MKNIAIVGAGISGLSTACILNDKGNSTVVFEKADAPGGLIRCSFEEGNLFHRVGGHVFNAKEEKVWQWFRQYFDIDREFLVAHRKAEIQIDGRQIGYPIENYLYELPVEIVMGTVKELLSVGECPKVADNFESFLRSTFGETLYHYYFGPYNTKVWNVDLSKVPLPWLSGKLPMPKVEEIVLSNILRHDEVDMVHSTFFYPRQNGSSFIADRLADGLNVVYNTTVVQIERCGNRWLVNGVLFDAVVYTGDVRRLSHVLSGVPDQLMACAVNVNSLLSNGTSNVLCYTDSTDLSWLYLPDIKLKCHRIIYTGNFSSRNNIHEKKTCTVEFSGRVDEQFICKQLRLLPGNLQPIAFNYESDSYVIQQHDTRDKIAILKEQLKRCGFYLVGRFAEWEYYNMDMAINSALDMCEENFP